MTEKKAFNEMADAIYNMHRLLKRIKQIQRTITDPNEARMEVRRECVQELKNASEKAKDYMDEWLREMSISLGDVG